eukprot:COSAG06_NODE_825_length_12067_cov_4.396975_5_plen_103_part_00
MHDTRTRVSLSSAFVSVWPLNSSSSTYRSHTHTHTHTHTHIHTRSQQPTSTPWHPPKVDNGRSDPISFWMPSSAQVTVRTNLQPGHMTDSKRLIDAHHAQTE